MRMLSVQEALQRVFDRQRRVDGLQIHASGHCAHVGRLSPGCQKCFVPDNFSANLYTGPRCNTNCDYCLGYSRGGELDDEVKRNQIRTLFLQAVQTDFTELIPSISFTSGGGEPLLFMDIITEYMAAVREIAPIVPKKIWCYLYTNGLLAGSDTLKKLREMGLDEMRFHIGASGFSEKVYRNIGLAVKELHTVTVETPAWPPHREQLFEMLPRIQDLGVKHLNIGQIEVTGDNHGRIQQVLPDAEVYQHHNLVLDDGGLVYDLIQEILERDYSFSVLDCNCFVKSIQRAPFKHVMHASVEGLCVEP